MFKEYLDDYYKSKVGVIEICELVGSSPATFRRWLKKNNLTPRQKYLKQINTGNNDLNQLLKDRYSSIINRCNGKTTDYYGNYKGMAYIPVYEWVDFCNENTNKLLELWEIYEENNCASRYAISIDRVDNELGYVSGNIQFVTHGFNSWKRSVLPIKVTHNDKTNYFLTKEEASLFYGLRRQAIGEVYNNSNYQVKGYLVEDSSIIEVLTENDLDDLEDYYNNLLEKNKKEVAKKTS